MIYQDASTYQSVLFWVIFLFILITIISFLCINDWKITSSSSAPWMALLKIFGYLLIFVSGAVFFLFCGHMLPFWNIDFTPEVLFDEDLFRFAGLSLILLGITFFWYNSGNRQTNAVNPSAMNQKGNMKHYIGGCVAIFILFILYGVASYFFIFQSTIADINSSAMIGFLFLLAFGGYMIFFQGWIKKNWLWARIAGFPIAITSTIVIILYFFYPASNLTSVGSFIALISMWVAIVQRKSQKEPTYCDLYPDDLMCI